MKILASIFIILFSFSHLFGQESSTISDCTVLYNISISSNNADPLALKSLAGTTKTLYIKGAKSRTDLDTRSFKQIMIYDSKSDSSIVLRELPNTKYISFLDGNRRKEKNRKYEGMSFTKTNEKKNILGYDCNKVIASLTDGSSYSVFYTSSIVPSVKDYEYQFKDLPGLVLEYEAELEHGKTKVTFTASKISLLPVPVAKFDIPKIGYRLL